MILAQSLVLKSYLGPSSLHMVDLHLCILEHRSVAITLIEDLGQLHPPGHPQLGGVVSRQLRLALPTFLHTQGLILELYRSRWEIIGTVGSL